LKIAAYILGGLLTYAVVGAAGVAIINATSDLGTNGSPSTLALGIKVIIGAFFLALAAFEFTVRKAGADTPRWMKTIESFGPGRAFLSGIVLLSPRLKNLLLLAAAVDAAGSAHLGPVPSSIAILLFVTITFCPVLAPLVVNLAQPPYRAAAVTGAWRTWLERNNAVVLATVFGVMGVKFVVDGLAGLLS